MVVTYLRGGGLSPYGYIGNLLNSRLTKNYGSAINTIEIYPRLPVPERLRPTSDDHFDEWQKSLGELPYLAFRRKLNRFELAFCSKHFSAAEMDEWDHWADGNRRDPNVSIETIRLAGDEIKQAIRLIRKRIKPSDDFDVVRFLADVEAALNSTPASLEEWNALAKIAEHEQEAANDAQCPWEQLDIDWSDYHPKARQVLDDPFYWDCVDDIAPHGNDTGADLLEDFQKWNKRNPKRSPLVFLDEMSKRMGIEPFDWSVTKKSDVLKLGKERSIEMGIANEAAIALAFAVLKVRADCPSDLADLAKCALERTSIVTSERRVKDEIKAEWDAKIKRMRAKLDASTR
jgi:uncharacterized protein YfeS